MKISPKYKNGYVFASKMSFISNNDVFVTMYKELPGGGIYHCYVKDNSKEYRDLVKKGYNKGYAILQTDTELNLMSKSKTQQIAVDELKCLKGLNYNPTNIRFRIDSYPIINNRIIREPRTDIYDFSASEL